MKTIINQRKDLFFIVGESQNSLFSIAPCELDNNKKAYSVGVEGICLGIYKSNEIAKENLLRVYEFINDPNRKTFEM